MSITDPTTRRRAELLETLGRASEELASSEGWQNWLHFARRFRRYSLQNQLLILAQRPGATFVAGYRTWQSLGRQVRKGERGIAILAPSTRRVEDETSDEKRVIVTGFRTVFVFDLAQTEGEAIPTVEFPPVRVPDLALRTQLIQAAETVGFPVALVAGDGSGARGWYAVKARTISLVESYPPESQVRTLLHELGHACDPVVGQPGSVRQERELVAESTAYLVGTQLGLGLEQASAHYVTSWGADRQRLTELATEVLAVAERVEQLLGPHFPQAVGK